LQFTEVNIDIPLSRLMHSLCNNDISIIKTHYYIKSCTTKLGSGSRHSTFIMCIKKEHDNKFYPVLNRHTHQVKVGFTEKDN